MAGNAFYPIPAFSPETGAHTIVKLMGDLIVRFQKTRPQSMIYEVIGDRSDPSSGSPVQQVLSNPVAIFEGVRDHQAGGRCYCGIPTCAYTNGGDMAETLGEFFDRVTDGARDDVTGEPAYNPYGDCIHYHWRNDEFYADRIDDKLTVYRSVATDDAVGCQIKGVSALQKKLGDFGIALNQQDGTPLAIFLFVSHVAAESSAEHAADREKMYKYVLEQVGNAKVELEHAG